MKQMSIIVPCFNESGNIPGIVDSFKEILKLNSNIEVLLVNNGSTDDSCEVLEKEIAGTDIQIVNVQENKGYGFGILQGLEAATAPVLAWTHADGQTDPADVITAYELYQQSADENLLVKGFRQERKWTEAFFSWGMQQLASLVLKTPLEEINAQPKLFSRSFYEAHIKDKAPCDFSLDLYLLYMATKHGDVKNIPVYFKKRLYGEAKGGGSLSGKIKLIKRTLVYIFDVAKNLKEEL